VQLSKLGHSFTEIGLAHEASYRQFFVFEILNWMVPRLSIK